MTINMHSSALNCRSGTWNGSRGIKVSGERREGSWSSCRQGAKKKGRIKGKGRFELEFWRVCAHTIHVVTGDLCQVWGGGSDENWSMRNGKWRISILVPGTRISSIFGCMVGGPLERAWMLVVEVELSSVSSRSGRVYISLCTLCFFLFFFLPVNLFRESIQVHTYFEQCNKLYL